MLKWNFHFAPHVHMCTDTTIHHGIACSTHLYFQYAIAMMSSQVQKQPHVVELSFLDEMVHLRRIIDDYILKNSLILQQGKSLPMGFCKAIANVFNGGKDYANNTLRLLISTSAKMSMGTVLMMRKIIDEECPRISKSFAGKTSTDLRLNLLDTRVFRTLINSKSLRGAKVFFAAETTDEDRQNHFALSSL